MSYTLDQLEQFVSSPHYDATTAGLIASRIPELARAKALPTDTARPGATAAPAAKPAPGAAGELISPGVRRIRGNLCNVHGKYGPCDKALSGKKKPRKGRQPAKPKQTDAQRAEARQAKRNQNADDVAKRMADSDTGLAPGGSAALIAFADGTQPTAEQAAGLASMGLAEQSSDGSYRMTPTGRAAVAAMHAGDYQRTVDTIARAGDAQGKRTARQTAAQERTSATQAKRQAASAERVRRAQARAAKKPSGGKKKPAATARPARKPRRGIASGTTASSGTIAGTPKPKPAKPEKAPAKQIAPALQAAADKLSQGATISDADTMALIRNGLARLNKDGELILTAAGMRATTKSAFKVFKDANGQHRWVAQSSTAFQDRDKEIVSTKALADDCQFADTHDNAYGPLRWWHTPGLDLGDCDFNAMHGRVLIESGTFRSAAIAQKVAQAASGLEISLGFLHLPNEPDADGVFHHIRRFERSLVPRGKASNRFTAFTVKETKTMFDPTKVAALKALGFSDDDITSLQTQASATEKTATDQGVAYKADPPDEITIGGVVYAVKAFPPKADAAPVEEETVVETDAIEDMPMEEEAADDPNALTLSPGDLSAIQEMLGAAIGQVMGGLDLEKKVAGHVQGMLAPYQATKDAEQAQAKEQIAALATQVAELTGSQPAARAYRPSSATDNVLTDATMLAAVKQLADPDANDIWADIKNGLGLSRPQ